MDCAYVKRLFSPAIDGYLTEFEQVNFEAHLKECPDCQRELELLNKISFHLKELASLPEYAVPDGFTGQVMSRLKETKKSRLLIIPAKWKAGFAAVATAIIIAGSTFGLSGGMKIAKESELALNGHPETKVLEQLPVASDMQPESSSPDRQKGDMLPDKSIDTADADKKLTDGSIRVTSKGNIDPVRETALSSPPAVLLNKDIKLTSTLLKIGTPFPSEVKKKALNFASSSGALSQVYPEQVTDDKKIQFIRLNTSTDRAPGLISELLGMGTVISNQGESRNITAKYNEALASYQELVAKMDAGGDQDKQVLAAQAEALKQQLDNWTEESKNHAIVLWIESPKNQ